MKSFKKHLINNILRGIAIITVAMLIGCGKLSVENYDKIKMGMTYTEIVEILGKPDRCGGTMGIKNCIWGNDSRYIMINFAAEKVILFSAEGL